MFLYIDVTAGGALLQIAVGGVAGTLAVSKLLLRRIRPARVSSESEDEAPEADLEASRREA